MRRVVVASSSSSSFGARVRLSTARRERVKSEAQPQCAGNARASSTRRPMGRRRGRFWSRGILPARVDALGWSRTRRGDGAGVDDASEGSGDE
jgi:hypothetical protein